MASCNGGGKQAVEVRETPAVEDTTVVEQPAAVAEVEAPVEAQVSSAQIEDEARVTAGEFCRAYKAYNNWERFLTAKAKARVKYLQENTDGDIIVQGSDGELQSMKLKSLYLKDNDNAIARITVIVTWGDETFTDERRLSMERVKEKWLIKDITDDDGESLIY